MFHWRGREGKGYDPGPVANYADKLLAEATAHHRAGQLPAALAAYDKLLATDPNHPDALHLSGLCAHQLGRPDLAYPRLAKACQLRPANPEYAFNAGRVLLEAGRPADALRHLSESARLAPNQPNAHLACAIALTELGQYDDAHARLGESLRLAPGNVPALAQRARLLVRQRRGPEALAAYAEVLTRQPGDPVLLNELAALQRNLGRLTESVATLERLVQLQPAFAAAHVNLGVAYQDRGEAARSIACFRRAVELEPANVPAHQYHLLALNRDWDATPEQVFAAHVEFGKRFEPSPAAAPPFRPIDDGKIRVGYLSPDFRDHSVAYFVGSILRHHDRDRFHVTCYSTTPASDAVTARLRGLADAWVDAAALSDEALAARIRSDGIDVLVDLAGHTSPRLMVLTRRPAPVQVTYLGYPNTTGLRSVDYRVTDALADPPGETDGWHTERLVRLPRTAWCYQPPADAPPVLSRGDRPVTFGSFNTFAKVGPQMIALWSRVLDAVPGSRLVLKAAALTDDGLRQHAAARFVEHGIPADRVTLLPYIPSTASHLSAYNDVDIALDTYPYHGTTTTCEALLMGVPVITLAGQAHVSRVGVSLLSAVGLGDLVAHTDEEYVRLAAALAGDAGRLRELRESLRDRLLASPLCDGVTFTRDLETFYHQACTSRNRP